MVDGTPVEGRFYEQDLQKVHLSDGALFRVAKLLEEKKGKVLVKWKGWTEKYNSWIPSQELKKLRVST